MTPSILARSSVLLSWVLVCASCGPTSANEGTSSSPEVVRREIRDLITALTPPPATALPVVKSEWHMKRKQTLERMLGMDQAHGLEALRVFQSEPPSLPEVRSGLLDVAAHTAPEATTPLLVDLVQKFGEDLYVRTQATAFLGECAPVRAIEVLEPVLRERFDDRTYPPEERMLAAWITANKTLGLDPVPLLAEIATDLHRPQEVRHLATRTLGEFDAPQSRQALQTLLVESSGNGYIRRLALQSLRSLLSKDDFCKLVADIQSHEADLDFINFLESARNSNCR